MLQRLLLVLAMMACNSSLPPGNGSTDLATAGDLATSKDLATAGDLGKAGCQKNADCRLFSDYCEGCACRALTAGEPDPVCTGMMVSCIVDPCSGMSASCSPAGTCTAQ